MGFWQTPKYVTENVALPSAYDRISDEVISDNKTQPEAGGIYDGESKKLLWYVPENEIIFCQCRYMNEIKSSFQNENVLPQQSQECANIKKSPKETDNKFIKYSHQTTIFQ